MVTLCFSYNVLVDVVARANFALEPDSVQVNKVSQEFYPLQSNFYQSPFKGYLIWTTTILENQMKYDQGFITVTDGEGNNVGCITFSNFFKDAVVNTPIESTVTIIQSLNYPIQTATGLFRDYKNGSVTFDYSDTKRQIWLFK